MKHKLLIVIPCLFACIFTYADETTGKAEPGEEVHSANGGDRLLDFYQRFQKSDLNSDGKLTIREMHDFLNQVIKNGAESDPTPNKTINLKKLRGVKSRAYLNAFYIETKGSADVSGDGVLTKSELLDYILDQKKVYDKEGKKIKITVNLEPNN